MALSGNTVWEVRNVADYASASDTNGGGFVTGASGTDYSYASLPSGGAAKYSLTGLTSSGAGNTLLTASASADMVGNIAYSVSGTNQTTGTGAVPFFQITSVSVGVSITFSTNSAGTAIATGVVAAGAINIGGCLATPGQAALIATVAGMAIWLRYSTTSYALTTATPGSGGPVALATASFSTYITLQGYDQTRGDRTGNLPVVSWASVGSPGSNTYIFTTNSDTIINNVAANGNNVANVCGFFNSVSGSASRGQLYGCIALNCSGSGAFGFTIGSSANYCEAKNCSTGFSVNTGAGAITNCFASGCSVSGFSVTGSQITEIIQSVAYNCGNGFIGKFGTTYVNCTADSNTTAGFVNDSSGGVVGAMFDSCLATNQSGGGAKGFVVGNGDQMYNCAVYNNTTHVSGTPTVNIGQITLTQQPYVTAGSDFRPNSTAGGGASLRGTSTSVFGQPVASNRDIGAMQHADSGGGSTYIFQVES